MMLQRIIENYARDIGLPLNISERAKGVYQAASRRHLFSGYKSDAIVVAALYAACRQQDYPLTLPYLCRITGAKQKFVGRIFNILVRELKLPVSPSSAKSYALRFCTALGLDPNVTQKTLETIAEAEPKISGVLPSSLAAGAIYYVNSTPGSFPTQRVIEDATGVTQTTIRNVCRLLEKNLEEG